LPGDEDGGEGDVGEHEQGDDRHQDGHRACEPWKSGLCHRL
jgi:hypothetical protein